MQPAAQKQKAPPKPKDGAAPAPAPVAPPQKKQTTAAAKPKFGGKTKAPAQKKQKTAAAKPKFGGKTKASTELICGCVEQLQTKILETHSLYANATELKPFHCQPKGSQARW